MVNGANPSIRQFGLDETGTSKQTYAFTSVTPLMGLSGYESGEKITQFGVVRRSGSCTSDQYSPVWKSDFIRI